MPIALFLLLLCAHLRSSHAQGLILFYNNNLTGPNGTYRAGIFQDDQPRISGDVKGDSTIGAGPGFTVGLFLAGSTRPLVSTTFRTTTARELFVEPKVVRVPGVRAGQIANLVVRAWETSAGSYENSPRRGEQAFTSRPLGDTVPVDLGPGFNGFEMEVPYFPSPLPPSLWVQLGESNNIVVGWPLGTRQFNLLSASHPHSDQW